jgi:hypothetical protein
MFLGAPVLELIARTKRDNREHKWYLCDTFELAAFFLVGYATTACIWKIAMTATGRTRAKQTGP